MAYNSNNQYRCTIIRGKAQNQLEDLLPVYSRIVLDCAGFEREAFINAFNVQIRKSTSSPTQKTIDNHRTEIAEKLYGLFCWDNDHLVPAARCKKLNEDNDLPAFFKSVVQKFQFPNGMDSHKTLLERLENKICVRPFHFIVQLVFEAKKVDLVLTKREIAYYCLNNLDVLQGIASIDDVLKCIRHDRKNNIYNKVEEPGKESSFTMQHITEQLNILECANIINIESFKNEKSVTLVDETDKFTALMLSKKYNELDFDCYGFLQDGELQYVELVNCWQNYFCSGKKDLESIAPTKISNLNKSIKDLLYSSGNQIELGDEGEALVFTKEKERIAQFNPRLAKEKVLLLGKQKGLGYDIQSVWANNPKRGSKPQDAPIYIEVKSTKRTTVPNPEFFDKITLTRTEWLKADEYKQSYHIYRVYFTKEGVFVHIIINPLSSDNVFCEPIAYVYEFKVCSALEEW